MAACLALSSKCELEPLDEGLGPDSEDRYKPAKAGSWPRSTWRASASPGGCPQTPAHLVLGQGQPWWYPCIAIPFWEGGRDCSWAVRYSSHMELCQFKLQIQFLGHAATFRVLSGHTWLAGSHHTGQHRHSPSPSQWYWPGFPGLEMWTSGPTGCSRKGSGQRPFSLLETSSTYQNLPLSAVCKPGHLAGYLRAGDRCSVADKGM